ncbi:hypothetical protein GQ42DRAFT_59857 [Ramicandelaber brevisporus]|nr:hypothetical protein GQ42DRAFT_59857 [Ramicandelaber brevisporus]
MATTQPDAKAQKYDRQLRLWAASGQAALENAHVCLLNGTTTGTEALKNLVLPGIGRFTVIDGNKVTADDLGSNFFVDESYVGASRAAAVTALLAELNEDTAGDYIARDPIDLLLSSSDEELRTVFSKFTVVIAANVYNDQALVKLGKLCYNELRIPLVVVTTCGFAGAVRLSVPEHFIVETHAESNVDLRVRSPFPALKQFIDAQDMDNQTSEAYAHTPWVAILNKALEQWRATTTSGKLLPTTFAEKKQVRELINKFRRSGTDDENIDQAFAKVLIVLDERLEMPDFARTLLEDPAAVNLAATNPSGFWVIVRAVRDFVANEGDGRLPLSGQVPDMKADTKRYVELQAIYRNKAKEDIAAITKRVHALLAERNLPSSYVSDEEIATFCKNAYSACVLRTSSAANEYSFDTTATTATQSILDDEDKRDMFAYYASLRAVNQFIQQHGHFPGEKRAADETSEDDHESEAAALHKVAVAQVAASTGANAGSVESSISSEPAQEIARCGGIQLHPTCAMIGGIVAQEATKLITNQYLTVDNLYVFDGAKMRSAVLRL